LKNPVRAADSIYIEDGVIQEIGTAIGRRSEIVVDAGGITAIPGLVDSHSHPTFGEFTPAQNSTTWINHYMHGGVTALISAGELHVPGLPLPPDPRTAPARRRSRPDRQGHRRLPGNLQLGQFTLVLTRRRDTHGILRTEQRIALIKDVEVFAVAMNIFVNKFVTSSALKGARQ